MTINEFAKTLDATENNVIEAVKELSLDKNMRAILDSEEDSLVWSEW